MYKKRILPNFFNCQLMLPWEAHNTFNYRTILITRILQPCQSQHSMHPNDRDLVSQSLQHTVINLVIQIIINLCIFSKIVQNFVDQLADSKPHSFVIGRVTLVGNKCKYYNQVYTNVTAIQRKLLWLNPCSIYTTWILAMILSPLDL